MSKGPLVTRTELRKRREAEEKEAERRQQEEQKLAEKAYKRKEKEISTFYRKEKKKQKVTSRRILETSRTEYLVKQGNYYCSDFISRCGIYRFEFIEKRNHYENWNYWSNGSRGQNSKRKIDRHDVMGTSRRFICFWFVRKT